MFETLTKGFKAARNRLAGVAELTEENIEQALGDVRLSLLEADVELGVVKRFLANVKADAVGTEFKKRVAHKGRKFEVGADEQFIKICQDHLERMMAFEGPAVDFAKRPKPTSIMIVGLQGSGKTTTAAKLARLLEKEHKRKPLLVAADVQRPGAIEQLQVLGEQIDIPVFAIPGGRPTDICERAMLHARKLKRDTILFDTAGRLAVDEELMQELADIKTRVEPNNVFLVVDAMIGQDSVKTAAAFHERIGLSGVVLTKLDGDARGGAALSVKEVTGAPIKFAGVGEGMDKLEQFRSAGMASRILGFGDIVGLMKDFEEVVDEKKAEADAKRMLSGQFTLDDFLEQIGALQQMGPLQDVLEKLPFFADSVPDGFTLDDKEISRTKAMVSSMTRAERQDIELFRQNHGRLDRVAKGSGTDTAAVAGLLQRFAMMREMMSGIGSQAGMLAKIPGMKQLASAKRLRDAVKTGGLEHNPMLANLADELLEAAVAEQGGPGRAAARRKVMSKDKKKALRKMKKKSRRKARK